MLTGAPGGTRTGRGQRDSNVVFGYQDCLWTLKTGPDDAALPVEILEHLPRFAVRLLNREFVGGGGGSFAEQSPHPNPRPARPGRGDQK